MTGRYKTRRRLGGLFKHKTIRLKNRYTKEFAKCVPVDSKFKKQCISNRKVIKPMKMFHILCIRNNLKDDIKIIKDDQLKLDYRTCSYFLQEYGIGIDDNILGLLEEFLYFKLQKQCMSIGLKAIITKDIIQMVLFAAIKAKRYHPQEDILQLIEILTTPRYMLQHLGIRQTSRLTLYDGICFTCTLPIQANITSYDNCRILITNSIQFIHETSDGLQGYTTMAQLENSVKLTRSLMHYLVAFKIQLVFCRNQIASELVNKFYKKGLLIIGGIEIKTLQRIALAAKCPVLNFVGADFIIKKSFGFVGHIDIVNGASCSMFKMSGFESFHGCSIILSSKYLNNDILVKCKRLLKSILFEIQGTLEQMQFVKDLEGVFNNQSGSFSQPIKNKDGTYSPITDDKLISFFTWLDLRFQLNNDKLKQTFDYNIFSNKASFTRRVPFLRYYTFKNELCGTVTLENIAVSEYSHGWFVSDFLYWYSSRLKINNCMEREGCTEGFGKHELHYESLGAGLFLRRATICSRYDLHISQSTDSCIHLFLTCKECNQQNTYVVKDLTFGCFLEMLFYSSCFLGSCGHNLFSDHSFTLMHQTFSLSFTVETITNYKIEPIYTNQFYNCTSLSISLMWTPYDNGLKRLKDMHYRASRFFDKFYGIEKLKNTSDDDGIDVKQNMFSATNVVPMLVFRSEKSQFNDARNTVFLELLNIIYNRLDKFTKMENIIDAIPCICHFSKNPINPQIYSNNNMWVYPMTFSTVAEFLQKFEHYGVFGIEPNSKFMNLINSVLRNDDNIKCKLCRRLLFESPMDFDILNWLFIFICIINGLVYKLKRLYFVVLYIIDNFNSASFMKDLIFKATDDVKFVLLQCITHLLYYKYFCPPDPMNIFMVVKCFINAILNICNNLWDSIEASPDSELINDILICDTGIDSIRILYRNASGENEIHNIDFVSSDKNDPFLLDMVNFIPTCYEIDQDTDNTELSNMENESIELVTFKKFIVNSRRFAFQCGYMLPLHSLKINANDYYNLFLKIRALIKVQNETVIASDYNVVPKPKRDVGVIIAECLNSQAYKAKIMESSLVQGKCCQLGLKMINVFPKCSNIVDLYKNCKWIIATESVAPLNKGGFLSHRILYRHLVKNIGYRHIFKCKANVNIDSVSNTSHYIIPTLHHFHMNTLASPLFGICMDNKATESLNQLIAFEQISISTKNPSNVDHCPLASSQCGFPIVYLNHETLNIKRTKWRKRHATGTLMDNFISVMFRNCYHDELPLQFIHSASIDYLYNSYCGILESIHISSCAEWEINKWVKAHEEYEFTTNTVLSVEEFDLKKTLDPDSKGVTSIGVLCRNEKYNITVYYPHIFHQLRHFSFGDDLNYIRSLCKSARMQSTAGKSGALLFVTYDQKLTLKLLNKYEMQLIVNEGPKFFRYIFSNDTLLSVPFGLYSINHLKTNTIINCLVMQNIDYFSLKKISFDLKGVSFKRFKSIPMKQSSPQSGGTPNRNVDINEMNQGTCDMIVLLDQNFKEYTGGCPLRLDCNSLDYFHTLVNNDLDLLASLDIVDYSLLLHLFPDEGFIAIGLIDFLRPYTWDKQIETIGKKLANIATGQAPTIISPREYRKRFLLFVDNIFSLSSNRNFPNEQNTQPEAAALIPKSLHYASPFLYFDGHDSNRPIYQNNSRICPQARSYLEWLLSRLQKSGGKAMNA
ncbi:bifunctional Phosphatidylinositol-4-phosphate 5-kinase [Babesia duncani]|uniref:Bifunctional Phosphatidylinositol-4-phosphate 5-kinase n=1 Tax=Babesia duncani TaxID=323732 RepID=A0AAD9UM68_9APIC|nr:bifunctional Phosphatidylinositol-4-phosphate 5-kinase [Babesia duncani]KAK2195284.1 bifunctional Phosphatidylinositol-4-phosphate 5-kinase [Babesia duncani]